MLARYVPNGHNAARMHLSQYLEKKKISPAAFGALIGKHRTTVVRLCAGTRRPDIDTIQKIHEVTKGQVKAEDFFADVKDGAA